VRTPYSVPLLAERCQILNSLGVLLANKSNGRLVGGLSRSATATETALVGIDRPRVLAHDRLARAYLVAGFSSRAGAGFANLFASIGKFGCTSESCVVDCPSVQVVTQ
jgi:hypothetical protein